LKLPDFSVETFLGRDRVALDQRGLSEYLTGKVIMITGAGGSIGAELARQAQRYAPSQLLLLERSEAALFKVHRELTQDESDASLINPLLADINDHHRMRLLFEEFKPHVVLHAAAHKHVPILESHPAEAVRNNVLATRTIGEFAGEFGADAFVLVSTDKAINPTSIMGASKRVAELVIQDLDAHFAQTRYLAVRFGNVIGSSGSVAEIFQHQIQQRQPLTITDKRMHRYFMSAFEAAQLVLQAGALGCGGEIFMLDMGSPVNIYDLACEMIRYHGLKPDEDIQIQITGIRPGEKLFEDLSTSEETYNHTRHPRILVSKIERYPSEKVAALLDCLTDHVYGNAADAGQIKRILGKFLPESRLKRVVSLRARDLQPA